MKSRDFVIWVDGFIEGKTSLGVDDIKHIKNKIKEVKSSNETERILIRESPPTEPIIINIPNDDSIDFPGKPPNIYMNG